MCRIQSAVLLAALLSTIAGGVVTRLTAQLAQDTDVVSVSRGGGPTFTLSAGAVHAGRPYLLVGSMSGTSPGLRLGPITVPLNFDSYTAFLDDNPNLLIARSFARLDAAGRATARYRLPAGLLGAVHVGRLLHHAYIVFDRSLMRFEMASIALPLTLVR